MEQTQVYQGQFGEFTITDSDRRDVIIYRGALALMALSFATGVVAVLWKGSDPVVIQILTPLYALFCIAMGVSLTLIHIYMSALHRFLQVCWLLGCGSALLIGLQTNQPLALTVMQYPVSLWGLGFTFVALTGIFFKEAFCFHRLETKILTPLVPVAILGHMSGLVSPTVEMYLLGCWAGLFLIFALRKVVQAIPPDIGDKSVFTYLRGQAR